MGAIRRPARHEFDELGNPSPVPADTHAMPVWVQIHEREWQATISGRLVVVASIDGPAVWITVYPTPDSWDAMATACIETASITVGQGVGEAMAGALAGT